MPIQGCTLPLPFVPSDGHPELVCSFAHAAICRGNFILLDYFDDEVTKDKDTFQVDLRTCRKLVSATLWSHFNPLKPELNPICYLLALLAHHFLHVSRIRVKSLTIRLLMSYIYMEHLFLMFLDHTQRRSTVGRTPLDE